MLSLPVRDPSCHTHRTHRANLHPSAVRIRDLKHLLVPHFVFPTPHRASHVGRRTGFLESPAHGRSGITRLAFIRPHNRLFHL